jgi:hypothetical protein
MEKLPKFFWSIAGSRISFEAHSKELIHWEVLNSRKAAK